VALKNYACFSFFGFEGWGFAVRHAQTRNNKTQEFTFRLSLRVACVSWTIRRLEKPVIIQSLEFLFLFVQVKRKKSPPGLRAIPYDLSFTRLPETIIKEYYIKKDTILKGITGLLV